VIGKAEFEELVMEMAFAIEDPCGKEAIELAREVLRFLIAVPPEGRAAIAAKFAECNNEVLWAMEV
jgi:hypothetical protein